MQRYIFVVQIRASVKKPRLYFRLTLKIPLNQIARIQRLSLNIQFLRNYYVLCFVAGYGAERFSRQLMATLIVLMEQ